ncbi:hypothetical protein Pfo_023070 [Paulownia fortunei]|nr:hypothetical protein Pfo_023070 [Paulownia fortunei]
MVSESKEFETMEEQKTTKISVWDLPDVPKGKLPPHFQLQKSRIENVQYSGAYESMGVDISLRLEEFSNSFRVEVIRLTEDDMELDMIGISIEKFLIANNTLVIQDEVLTHRLGLIPLKVDQDCLIIENDEPNEKNAIVFKLHVCCERGSSCIKVKSNELKWLPNSSEFILSARKLTLHLLEFSNNPIAPKHDNIIISKLGPGQVWFIVEYHAKWSPVATAWYRMLREVVLLQEIEDEKAEELLEKFPVKVFDIEDIGKGRKGATIARPRCCTLLLFTEAVKILEDKCERVITELS